MTFYFHFFYFWLLTNSVLKLRRRERMDPDNISEMCIVNEDGGGEVQMGTSWTHVSWYPSLALIVSINYIFGCLPTHLLVLRLCCLLLLVLWLRWMFWVTHHLRWHLTFARLSHAVECIVVILPTAWISNALLCDLFMMIHLCSVQCPWQVSEWVSEFHVYNIHSDKDALRLPYVPAK